MVTVKGSIWTRRSNASMSVRRADANCKYSINEIRRGTSSFVLPRLKLRREEIIFFTGRDYSRYKVDNVYVCICRIPPFGGCNAVRRRAIDRYRVTIIDESAALLSSHYFFFISAPRFSAPPPPPPPAPLPITNKHRNQMITLRRYVTISMIRGR